jgi:hypothetical protein
VGQGLANLAVAFVGGYPVRASLSGTSVNLAGGARGPRPIYFFTALAVLANVYQLLSAVNRRAARGVPYGGDGSLADLAEDLLERLNRAGD